MLQHIDSYISTLEELQITANQYLLCFLLYTDKKVQDGEKLTYVSKGSAIANLWRYATRIKPWSDEEILDLVDKGYLTNKNKTREISPDLLEITPKFTENVFCGETQFQEFWREYPAFVPNFNNPNGPKIKLKVTDPMELEQLYVKIVKTKSEHIRVMSIMKWARDNNQLNMNIKNFVVSRVWNDLEVEKQRYTNTYNRLGN